MAKSDLIDAEGIVTDKFPGAKFEVTINNDSGNELKVTASLSGKLRKNFIKILKGDKVQISLSPYDMTRGIITYRLK